MITLVIVKNPFSPKDGREIQYIEGSGTLAALKEQYAMPGVDLMATVNGYSVEDDTVINDGDFIVIYPAIEKGGGKGKSILGLVAAIALSVVSFGVGGIASGLGWGASMASWTAAGYIAAAAVMFLGSSLIGRMTGQKVDAGSYGGENEATYSWGGVQTMEGQNNPIALTYGTVKSGGQTIGKYTMASGSDDYLYWLIAAGEGELAFSDIKLNDNPISMYQGVSYQTRTGTNDQSVIPYFGDTRFTAPLSYNMEEETWYTNSAQGTATQGLIVKVECPNGLLHTTSQGKVRENYVAIQIQVQDVTGGSSWTDYSYFDGADMTDWDSTKNALIIKGNSRTAIRKEFRIDGIDPSEYAVRVRVSDIGYKNEQMDMYQTYWTGLSSIVYDDFCYPCTALIGIKAKATDQLSGSPTLTFMKSRNVVYVWNPHDNEYQTKLADNPAWACYDLIHQCRPLKNINTGSYEYEVRGAAKELMRYDDFKEWADYCDAQNYYVNIEIVRIGEMLDVANEKIAPIGHGRVVRFGTKYGCIYAHPQEAVQMFGMGNIVTGTFKEEFLKVADRANCVEVTFTNAKADYQRDVLTIYGETYDTDGYEKTAQVTMDGITNFSQAYREGVYQLQCNKLQLRTVTFEAGIDSIACTVGDVVMIAHDVPQWQFSGRIESVDGNTVLLPCEVADTTATYVLQWRMSATDVLYEKNCTIVSSADGWTTATISGDPVTTITAGDIFSLAESGTENKLFTVQSITRAQDFTRMLTCIEYNEDVFEEPTNYDGDDERPKVFVVAIQQYENQSITVRKYKGSESIEYTTSFTESETGWYIEINLDSPAGYAPGELLVNGVVYNTGVDFPLNRNYTITATNAAVGQTAYINGTTTHPYGSSGIGNRWFVMYSDSACQQSINRNDLVGRLRCIDTNGSLQIGDAMFGIAGTWTNTGGWCQYVTEIEQHIDTSSITGFQDCFNKCYRLQDVNLTNWDTGNATSFFAMFRECRSLLHVGDISDWDTAYVTSISQMFNDDNVIQSLDLSGWNTPRLVNCNRTFQNCYALRVVDISGWDTTNINDVNSMFNGDSALEYVIMDAHEIKFSGSVVMPTPNNACKYLVPADMVEIYKAHANWSSRASQIDSIANYNIIRSNGHVTVTER